jgi:hypothetical protein
MTDLDLIKDRYPWYENDPGYMEFMTAGDLAILIRTIETLKNEASRLKSERLMSVIFGTPEDAGKPFVLYRHRDVSGVSGTGIVADGFEFPDGRVCMRWRGEDGSTVIHDSITTVEKIHGHGGNTVVVWISEDLGTMAEAEARIEELEAELEALRRGVA